MAESIKKCKKCGKNFLIIAQEAEFYKKKDLPDPCNCPDCRREARLSFKNPRKLHKSTCAKCKEAIITTYAPETPYKIYCQKCYWQEMH